MSAPKPTARPLPKDLARSIRRSTPKAKPPRYSGRDSRSWLVKSTDGIVLAKGFSGYGEAADWARNYGGMAVAA